MGRDPETFFNSASFKSVLGKRAFTKSNEVTARFLAIVHLVQVLLFGNVRTTRLHRERERARQTTHPLFQER